ncbi:MAG: trypsin-like peptidase domain-containing protein [Patescibacteria group bacterium]|nr:trypsin-like peptidase domain-containing protein [Patescibacteria group bacterium]
MFKKILISLFAFLIILTFLFIGVVIGSEVNFTFLEQTLEEDQKDNNLALNSNKIDDIQEEEKEEEQYVPQLEHEEMIIDVVEKNIPSVVSIISYSFGVESGRGTGFIISKDGFILTNRHIVYEEEAEYKVYLSTGETFLAEIVAKDPFQDLAVLKINATDLPVVVFGNSDNICIGQTAVAIGNALGEFENTVSVGVISGTGRSIRALGPEKSELLDDVIQTDAAINFGNSGGPLLNIKGEVVGINTAVATSAEGIGFAIPINKAKKAVRGAVEEGEIIYPFLGVHYLMVNEEIQEEKNLPIDYGAVIVSREGQTAVTPGSAAEKAGLREGDIILEINGERIDSDNHLAGVISSYEPRDEIEIKILRNNQSFVTLTVTLGEIK